jgi:glutaredoxin 3
MAPVEIYTTPYCGYCRAAKALLTRKNVPFTEIDVSGDDTLREAMIVRANGGMTVPQIFIGGVHVGGSDELHALERAGKLDSLLESQAAS